MTPTGVAFPERIEDSPPQSADPAWPGESLEDFRQRIYDPRRPALTREDLRVCSEARDAWEKRLVEWRRQEIREGRGRYVSGLPVTDEQFSEVWVPRNAAGKVDGRLYGYRGQSRIPLIKADGEQWYAGERGNDYEQVKIEVINCELMPEERQEMLDWLDSSECFEKMLIYRMLHYEDLGPETEELLRGAPLDARTRENLEHNFYNLRRSRREQEETKEE